MKFTNGYWRIREEIEPVYAVEYYDSEKNNNQLTIYAATKHMGVRGRHLKSAHAYGDIFKSHGKRD